MWLSIAHKTVLGWLALAYFGQLDRARVWDDASDRLRGTFVGAQAEYELTCAETDENAPHQSIRLNQPVVKWQLKPLRARYQGRLKTARQNRPAEKAYRVVLTRVSQDEQAMKAARTIEAILANSHRRDREVTVIRKRIAAAARTHARGYQAMGFIQPSAQESDGRKLYVLVGTNGKTVAYLDLPPGLDPDPLLTQRVGVRGVPRYSEDLGARLIRVRALESLESK